MSSDEAQSDDWVSLGKIGAPYGVKGWVKLHSFTDPMENIRDYRHFRARQGKHEFRLELDGIKAHGKGLIAHVSGYDEPETARRLTGSELGVDAGELPALDNDEYYWFDLLGLTVTTRSGDTLGKVSRLMETGANDVLVVDPVAGSVDNRQHLIPWLPEQVILEVDLQRKTLLVDWEPDWL